MATSKTSFSNWLQDFQAKLGLNSKESKKHSNANIQRAAAWKSTGIVALREAGIHVIPDPVFSLGPAVRTLDASGNKIDHLPSEGLRMLTGATRVVLAGNQLKSIPASLGALVSLKVLILDSNRLETLPSEIGRCSRLEHLSLASNALQDLPPALGSLKELRLLNMRDNRLRRLPVTLGGLEQLEELSVAGNELECLPQSTENLTQLTSLNAENNKLCQLPSQLLVSCAKLRTLQVDGNPLEYHYLEEMDGYDAFASRMKAKADKQIAGNVLTR